MINENFNLLVVNPPEYSVDDTAFRSSSIQLIMIMTTFASYGTLKEVWEQLKDKHLRYFQIEYHESFENAETIKVRQRNYYENGQTQTVLIATKK